MTFISNMDLVKFMRNLLAPDIAILESDLVDDWLQVCKDAGVPASRYQGVAPRQLLRDLEATGDAVREVDRGGNGTGLPVTSWGGRGFVPRTPAVAVRVEPKAKREKPAPKANKSKAARLAPASPEDVALSCLRAELAQIKAQVKRIEAQVSLMERRATTPP